VIIDESSQVDLATGALALSCAKRADCGRLKAVAKCG